MEKDTKIVIGAIAILVVMIFIFNVGITGQPIFSRIRMPSTSCTDSDGSNYNVRGTCTNARGEVSTDTCASSRILREYYCVLGACRYVSYNCPSGYVCSNGACARPVITSTPTIPPVITYRDGDTYIGEDPNNPNWVWKLEGLTTSSFWFGIKNYFIRDDNTDNPPGVGECYNLPNNFARICLNGLNVRDDSYLTTTITYDVVDLGNVDPLSEALSSAESVVRISAPGSLRFMLNNEVATSRIYIAFANNEFKVYFDGGGRLRYLGEFGDGVSYNVGRMNYGSTQNIQIYLNYITRVGELVVAFRSPIDEVSANFRVVNNRLGSLGNIVSMAESRELLWGAQYSPVVSIGTKDRDHRTAYGIIIRNPRLNGASDRVILQIPNQQVEGQVEIRKGDGRRLDVEHIPLDMGLSGLGGFSSQTYIESEYPRQLLILTNSLSPSLETSLTSQDDDYGTNVFMEAGRGSIECMYGERITVGSTINFLGRQLRIISMTDNSITVEQVGISPMTSVQLPGQINAP